MAARDSRNASEAKAIPDLPRDLEAAEYLAGILPEVVRIANRSGLEVVAYLLDMARTAADEELQSSRKSPRG